MYQKVTIVGYLGQDPQIRYTPDGTPVASFGVATSRKWNTDGNKGEETTWFRVSAWRRMAETCNEYLKKGRPVLIEGRLKPDSNGGPRVWTGNDGAARASYELVAQRIVFLPYRDTNNGASASSTPQTDDWGQDEVPF